MRRIFVTGQALQVGVAEVADGVEIVQQVRGLRVGLGLEVQRLAEPKLPGRGISTLAARPPGG